MTRSTLFLRVWRTLDARARSHGRPAPTIGEARALWRVVSRHA